MKIHFIIPSLPQEEHDRLDRESEKWRRENPKLAAIRDPIYPIGPPLTKEQEAECLETHRKMKEWLRE